jgi:hypothetical protein
MELWFKNFIGTCKVMPICPIINGPISFDYISTGKVMPICPIFNGHIGFDYIFTGI